MAQSRTRQRPAAELPTLLQHLPFDAGRLTSDGGLAWIAQADATLGLCTTLTDQLREWRRGPVQHALVMLVRQRVFQITCGYEDQNDADALRHDPLLKWVCGRRPESGWGGAGQPAHALAAGERRERPHLLPAGRRAAGHLPPGARAT